MTSDAWFGAYDGETTDDCGNDEAIADKLFAWIKSSRARVRVGEPLP